MEGVRGSGLQWDGKEGNADFSEEMGRVPSTLSGWGSARKKGVSRQSKGVSFSLVWVLVLNRFSTAGSLVAINGSERG